MAEQTPADDALDLVELAAAAICDSDGVTQTWGKLHRTTADHYRRLAAQVLNVVAPEIEQRAHARAARTLAQLATEDASGEPRRFQLVRHRDVTGVSGAGLVADGVLWPDGTASVRWRGEHPSIVFWDRGLESIERVHLHGGATVVRWLDAREAAGA
ncbi:hypothetical protein [Actinomadura litoris]|uniref:hypothetical protein n=1 Tax=Actinomadura litoris TaxID=2678616 RepID=UPI001C12C6BE|nr:hypothetical protein [Actinomadura litoris]